MPSKTDPTTGEEYETIYVQVINPMTIFHKDKLEWPDEKDEAHKNDPPKSFRIDVHGYDELGRKTRPIFEVPDCAEIQLAIHNENVKDPETKKILYHGRLIQVPDKDLKNFPMWTGHPVISDTPEEVVRKVLSIRRNQKIGDKILGEVSKPYRLPSDDSDNSFLLRELFREGVKLLTDQKDKAEVKGADEIPVTIRRNIEEQGTIEERKAAERRQAEEAAKAESKEKVAAA